MARLLSSLRELREGWMTFWWTPTDGTTLGMIRVLTGTMLVYNLLVWGTDLTAFFGHDGLQPLHAIQRLHDGSSMFSFWMHVPERWLYPVHWLCVAVAVFFTVGLATRPMSILAYVITISYSQRVPVANFGLDQILGMLCLYLAIGPSGLRLSVDSWLKRRFSKSEPTTASPSCGMALRLIQLHMCVIYFWAGFAKLKGEVWWTGDAMWSVLANEEYQTLDLTWMAWTPWLPAVIGYATVIWEVYFCVLIWNRRLRPFILAIGTLMHFGIGAFLGMWTFGLVMTYAYFAFSSPEDWRLRWEWIEQRYFTRRSLAELANSPGTAGVPVSSARKSKPKAKPASVKEDLRPARKKDSVAPTKAKQQPPKQQPPTRQPQPVETEAVNVAVAETPQPSVTEGETLAPVADEVPATRVSKFKPLKKSTLPSRLTSDAEDSSGPPASPEVLIVAKNDRERGSLVASLIRHDIPNRSFVDINGAQDYLGRRPVAAMVICGSELKSNELANAVLTIRRQPNGIGLALNVILTDTQLKEIPKERLSATVFQYPVTPKAVRLHLKQQVLELDSLEANEPAAADNATDSQPAN